MTYSGLFQYFAIGVTYSALTDGFLDGSIDEVNYWNRILEVNEIAIVSKHPVPISFYTIINSPINGTGVTTDTEINFSIGYVNTVASCDLLSEGIVLGSLPSLADGTYSILYNVTDMVYGMNNISIHCTNTTDSSHDNISISASTGTFSSA